MGFEETILNGLELILLKMYFCWSTHIQNENKTNWLADRTAHGIIFMGSKKNRTGSAS